MDLASFRKSRGLSLEECAKELGLSPTSKGWISEIERDRRDASLKLAMKIERWSKGAVKATSICSLASQVAQQGEAA